MSRVRCRGEEPGVEKGLMVGPESCPSAPCHILPVISTSGFTAARSSQVVKGGLVRWGLARRAQPTRSSNRLGDARFPVLRHRNRACGDRFSD